MFSFQSFPLPRSYLALDTSNGYGATSVMVRRYSNVLSNVGSAITYADNANTGAQFTINEDGIYTLGRVEQTSAAAFFGFSLNANAGGATAINLLVWPAKIVYATCTTADSFLGNSFFFQAGSIIRPHDDGNCEPILGAAKIFITQVSK